jgi:hypothetical protein
MNEIAFVNRHRDQPPRIFHRNIGPGHFNPAIAAQNPFRQRGRRTK